ncbi:hypothetical protein WMY93_023449 [Mugilogobius chulae]|uniref:Anoctamin n=1 Tax=Mugilogobius chulae TaxID=88201 RepID=A0AAW0N5S3_9GOBI
MSETPNLHSSTLVSLVRSLSGISLDVTNGGALSAQDKNHSAPPVTGIELGQGLYFSDGKRKVDYVLSFKYKKRRASKSRLSIASNGKSGDCPTTVEPEEQKLTEEEKVLMREEFEAQLVEAGLQLERDKERAHGMMFLRIHIPWTILSREAELQKIKVAVKKKCDLRKRTGIAGLWDHALVKISTPFQPDVPDLEIQRDPKTRIRFKTLKYAFIRDKLHLYDIKSTETLFDNATRSRIVAEMISRITCTQTCQTTGIQSLLAQGVYESAFPLHDGSFTRRGRRDQRNDRQILHEEWANYGVMHKYQPVDLIRKYFGEQIGLYFAWLGVYTQLLIPPSLLGIIVFLYGIFTVDSNIPRYTCLLHLSAPPVCSTCLHHLSTPVYTCLHLSAPPVCTTCLHLSTSVCTCLHHLSTPVCTCLHLSAPPVCTCLHLSAPPVYTCLHLSAPVYTTCLHLSALVCTCLHHLSTSVCTTCLHLSAPVYTCLHLSAPPVYICLHLSTPVYICLHHLSTSVCTCLHLSTSVCTCLHHLSTPVCSCLHLSAPVCTTCLHLSVPDYTSLLLSAPPVYTCLLLSAPPVYTCLHLSTSVCTCLLLCAPPVYICLHLSVPLCSRLHHLSTPVCSCLLLSTPVYTCLHLSTPVCTCQSVSIITNTFSPVLIEMHSSHPSCVLCVTVCPLCDSVSSVLQCVLCVTVCPLCDSVSSCVLCVTVCPLCYSQEACNERLNITMCPLCDSVSSVQEACNERLNITMCPLCYSVSSVQEACNERLNITMCPLCDGVCDYWQLSSVCSLARATYLFDNGATVLFAIFMSLWAACFLEHWKRRQMYLKHAWDLTSMQDDEERVQEELRPEYESALQDKRERMKAKAKKKVKSEEETDQMLIFQQEIETLDIEDHLCGYLINVSTFIFLIMVTFSAVIGVAVYRICMLSVWSMNPDPEAKASVRMTVTTTGIVLNMLVVLVLEEVYGAIAEWLTELEIPRTKEEFGERLIFKSFFLKSMNAFAPIFYVAFFKGRFSGRPGDYVYAFGDYRMEECAPPGCLIELCIQLSMIMLGKQLIQNNVFEILVPKMKKMYRSFQEQKGERKAAEEEEAEVEGKRPKQQYHKDHTLEPFEGVTPIIQFGFVSLFVASFPLAPAFALLNNVIEIRLDASKFVTEIRRPDAVRCKDIVSNLPKNAFLACFCLFPFPLVFICYIHNCCHFFFFMLSQGFGFHILCGISKFAVITNAFVISFTSEFVPRMVYQYMYSVNGTMAGYTEHSLAYFNVSNFAPGSAPTSTQLSGVSVCRYKDYRDPPWASEAYTFSKQYWAMLAAKLAFVIFFQNLAMFLSLVVAWIIPDVPRSLRDQLKKENMMLMEFLVNHDKDARGRNFRSSPSSACNINVVVEAPAEEQEENLVLDEEELSFGSSYVHPSDSDPDIVKSFSQAAGEQTEEDSEELKQERVEKLQHDIETQALEALMTELVVSDCPSTSPAESPHSACEQQLQHEPQSPVDVLSKPNSTHSLLQTREPESSVEVLRKPGSEHSLLQKRALESSVEVPRKPGSAHSLLQRSEAQASVDVSRKPGSAHILRQHSESHSPVVKPSSAHSLHSSRTLSDTAGWRTYVLIDPPPAVYSRRQPAPTQPLQQSVRAPEEDVHPSAPSPEDLRPSVSPPADLRPSAPSPADLRPSASSPADLRPSASSPADLRPSAPSPADLRPSAPSPADLDPSAPSPADLRPSAPSPADLRPSAPSPADLRPSASSPADLRPSASSPADLRPSAPSPADLRPSAPSPADLDPSAPSPADLRPSAPSPADLRPSASSPADLRPSAPSPADLRPSASSPADLRPSAPSPADLDPSAPSPADLRPSAPSPADLRPSAPSPADLRPSLPLQQTSDPLLPLQQTSDPLLPLQQTSDPLLPLQQTSTPLLPLQQTSDPLLPLQQTSDPLLPLQQTSDPLLPLQQTSDPLLPLQQTSDPLLPLQQTSTPLLPLQQTSDPLLPLQQTSDPLLPLQQTSDPLLPLQQTSDPLLPLQQTSDPLLPLQQTSDPLLPLQQTSDLLLQLSGSAPASASDLLASPPPGSDPQQAKGSLTELFRLKGPPPQPPRSRAKGRCSTLPPRQRPPGPEERQTKPSHSISLSTLGERAAGEGLTEHHTEQDSLLPRPLELILLFEGFVLWVMFLNSPLLQFCLVDNRQINQWHLHSVS